MSFIKNIFKNPTETSKIAVSRVNWIQLTSLSQLEEIKEISKSEPIAIFKHSTRCGISRMVLNSFEKQMDESLKNFKVYYLDLLAYRGLSDEVGFTFQVRHQSPQLLVIKNGVLAAHASHYDVTRIDLSSF